MSRLTAFRSLLGRLRRDCRGAIGVLFAVMLLPLIGGVGAAIDYARMVQAKTDLQSIVDQAALAGATVFVDSSTTSQTAAVTAATNYFNSRLLPTGVGASLSGTPVATPGGSNGTACTAGCTNFGSVSNTVQVTATASLAPSVLTFWTNSLSVAATATAGNPQASPTVGFSNVKSSACDYNAIYLYQLPIVNGQPSYTTVPAFTTGANGNYWQIGNNINAPKPTGQSTNPPNLTSANIAIGFLMVNKTNGNTQNPCNVHGANSYGAIDGSTQYFYSSFLPAGLPPSQQTNYSYTASVTENNNTTPQITGASFSSVTIPTGPNTTYVTPAASCSNCALYHYTGGASGGSGTHVCSTSSLIRNGTATLNCTTQYPTGSSGTPNMNLQVQVGLSASQVTSFNNNQLATPPANGSFATNTSWAKFGAVTCASVSQLSQNTAIYWWNDGGGQANHYTVGGTDDHDYNDAYFSMKCIPAIGGVNGNPNTEVVLIN